ncbi:Type IV pilus biogenesis and competence protein PilQ precursor [Marinobacterium sp. xm-g-59]|uniref:type IV pilus secretin family protein n=1 Tax=Marinobacterium sp. xm-g-59 TaxID=2497748 RepID=UPI0019F4786A|nr:type IV pilus secretin family protein [Marinobacterium sp. xm-g-59]NRP95889.1 Type IV pilus biogenesis and competence protein PilQ precursor [Marinobacterium sp. xm-g-59]
MNMKRWKLNMSVQRLVTLVTLMLMSTMASAQTLNAVVATALPGNQTELRFDFTDQPAEPKIYAVDTPARLVVDLWGVDKSEQLDRSISVGSGPVSKLRFAETNDRLRVVVELTESVGYQTSVQGNQLILSMGNSTQASAATAATASKAAPAQKTTVDDTTRVVGVDFERLEGNQGRVTISLSDDRAGLDIIEEGNGVIVNLVGATLAPGLSQKLDVKAFATPINFIDSMNADGSAAILILPSSDPYDYLAYQSNNQLVLDFKPISLSAQADLQKDLFPFTGEEIDLNFQNVEVRSVLQIIAEVAEKNLVVGDEVSGNTTLRLKNVPWDQALDIILKTNGLDKRVVGNVMLVGDATQIADRERQELENQQQVKELAPLVTEYIQIDYRRASEMKEYLSAANLISERGFVLADDQTNVLMVRETNAAIEDIRRTLKRFDVEVAQIMVEARIVTANTSFSENIGVKWGMFKTLETNGNTIQLGGKTDFGDSALAIPGSLGVDFGTATGPAFAVGFLSNSLLLQAELAALESSGDGEVISQPRVITMNGKVGKISSGTAREVITQDENGNSISDFVDILLTLEVTPQLNPGGRIAMDLNINQETPIPTSTDVEKNTLNTSVVVRDGDTIVLGGVFKTDSRTGREKVPFFGDLPVVGNAFKYRSTSEFKDELLIFITPKLIRESLNVR